MNHQVLKKPLPKVLVTGLLLCTQPILAHDEIKITQVLEGTEVDNAITIAHSCEASNTPLRAQSVVFPTVSPELIASDGRAINNLSEILGNTLYAAHVRLIQNKDIFSIQNERHDALGNTIGFISNSGLLKTTLLGRVPFQFGAPTFLSTSCAVALKIEVAIADICMFSAPTIQGTKVNLWIPDNGSHYAVLGNASGVDGIGDQPFIQVNRDLINNPLAPACGNGFTATVRPSATDIDTHLGFAGWHY